MNQIIIPKLKGLCPGYLPLGGGIVLLVADTEHGKSPLAYRAVATCTALVPFVPDVLPTISKPMTALVFNGEDPRKDIEPRLIAAGANMKSVEFFDCVVDRPDIKLGDIPDIVSQHRNVGLVLIDPLHSFVNVGVSPYAVRQTLAPFHKLVAERGITFLIPHHTIKNREKVRNPLDLAAGSKGWVQNAPMVWQIEKDEQGNFILEMTKGRKIPDPKPCFEYWCESWEQDPSVPVAVIGAPSEKRIAHILGANSPTSSGAQPPSVARALEWLREYLKDGPRLKTDIIAGGNLVGHSEPALVKAKKAGKIEHTPQGSGPSKWFMPPEPTDSVDSVVPPAPTQTESTESKEATAAVYDPEPWLSLARTRAATARACRLYAMTQEEFQSTQQPDAAEERVRIAGPQLSTGNRTAKVRSLRAKPSEPAEATYDSAKAAAKALGDHLNSPFGAEGIAIRLAAGAQLSKSANHNYQTQGDDWRARIDSRAAKIRDKMKVIEVTRTTKPPVRPHSGKNPQIQDRPGTLLNIAQYLVDSGGDYGGLSDRQKRIYGKEVNRAVVDGLVATLKPTDRQSPQR